MLSPSPSSVTITGSNRHNSCLLTWNLFSKAWICLSAIFKAVVNSRFAVNWESLCFWILLSAALACSSSYSQIPNCWDFNSKLEVVAVSNVSNRESSLVVATNSSWRADAVISWASRTTVASCKSAVVSRSCVSHSSLISENSNESCKFLFIVALSLFNSSVFQVETFFRASAFCSLSESCTRNFSISSSEARIISAVSCLLSSSREFNISTSATACFRVWDMVSNSDSWSVTKLSNISFVSCKDNISALQVDSSNS